MARTGVWGGIEGEEAMCARYPIPRPILRQDSQVCPGDTNWTTFQHGRAELLVPLRFRLHLSETPKHKYQLHGLQAGNKFA